MIRIGDPPNVLSSLCFRADDAGMAVLRPRLDGTICCRVPEITTLEETEVQSAVMEMSAGSFSAQRPEVLANLSTRLGCWSAQRFTIIYKNPRKGLIEFFIGRPLQYIHIPAQQSKSLSFGGCHERFETHPDGSSGCFIWIDCR
jgi:hypothetical protein